MKPEFLSLLDTLRDELDDIIIITSGYRCESYNKKVGGKPNSEHLHGNAADLASPSLERLFEIAPELFAAIGDGRKRGFIHVDGRADRPRRWSY